MATMTAMRAKAPTLVWLLTALSCLLVGMVIVESRHQSVAPPVLSSVSPVETVEAAFPPTATPEPIPTPILGVEAATVLPANPRFEDIPVPRSDDPTVLRMVRLTIPAGARLPPEAASGPTALLVESGNLSVWVENLILIGQGNEQAYFDAALSAEDRLVIASGARYTVRNNGPIPAVALVVAVVPVGTPVPTLAAGVLP
jgi:redox-sensitive bicupin YhaK (pirin superfamily)